MCTSRKIHKRRRKRELLAVAVLKSLLTPSSTCDCDVGRGERERERERGKKKKERWDGSEAWAILNGKALLYHVSLRAEVCMGCPRLSPGALPVCLCARREPSFGNKENERGRKCASSFIRVLTNTKSAQ